MIQRDRRALLVGFAVAAVVLGALFWIVGAHEVYRTLVRADLAYVALVGVTAVAWIAAWGLVLRTVLGILGNGQSVVTSVLVYAAAVFANNVTPFGQAGGEPITALIISDVTDTDYERGLAAIASIDALNFVPSITLALTGFGVFAARGTLGDRLERLALMVVALAILVPVVSALGWHLRYEIADAIAGTTGPLLERLERVVPRITIPGPEELRYRIEGFFQAIERIADSPRGLVVAVGYSTLGWALQAAGLWIAFLAFDVAIPVYVPLFVIPLGTIASVLPTPGALGGTEAVHVALLTLTTPATAATVAAAVAIHRVGGFFLVTSIGGGAMAFLWTRSEGDTRPDYR